MNNPITYLIDSLFKPAPVSNTPGLEPSIIKQYNKTRSGTNHIGLCHAPSVNMYLSQDGYIKACCHNMEFSIGKYPEQSLKEIWHSDKAKQFREYMRNNELLGGCSICVADMKTKSFSEVRARHFDVLPVNPEYPTMMEFLLTNVCNLECVMCKGEFSSLIRKNRENLPPIQSPYDQAFLQQLEEFIPHLKETRFSGSGEAFSIDMNYDIWEMLTTRNPECLIMVQTNGTILTGRVKQILAKGKFQIGVSLDSLQKEVFEAIRINANFDKIMDNIKYFHAYCKQRGTRFNISTCVMRQNWRELPDFINFCNGLDCVATFHKVWFPKEYGLHTLPVEEIREIYQYLDSFDFPMDTPVQKTNRNHYKYFVTVVKDWMENPVVEEVISAETVTLPADQLMPQLKTQLANYIRTLEAANADVQLTSCLDKVNALLSKFSEVEQEYVLRRLCSSPMKIIFESFVKYPVEYLFEEGKKDIEQNAELVSK